MTSGAKNSGDPTNDVALDDILDALSLSPSRTPLSLKFALTPSVSLGPSQVDPRHL